MSYEEIAEDLILRYGVELAYENVFEELDEYDLNKDERATAADAICHLIDRATITFN